MKTVILPFLLLLVCITLIPRTVRADEPSKPVDQIVLDKVVAVVNDEVITWLELYQTLGFEMAEALEGKTAEQKKAILKKNEKAYLDVMIEQRLQLQEAKRLGIEVTDDEVTAAIDNIRDKYGMDEAAFKEAIEKEGLPIEKYRDFIKDQISIGRVLDKSVKQHLDLSQEEIRHELERLGLKEGNYYQLKQIFFLLGPGERYENIESKVNAALNALRAGEDFGSVARKYSEGPAAQRGGDLGLVPADQISKEFIQAIEGLSPGEVSAPFLTPRGVHIILYEGTHDVRDVVIERKFEQESRDWLRRLRERSVVEVRL
jgi:peptidyl-prolyl cis-trans isomerase SurA